MRLFQTICAHMVSFIVKNIFNKDPVHVGIDPPADLFQYSQTARPLFDTIGRVFRMALISKF